MRLFGQYLQAYWRPLIGTFVQQPAALSAPDLTVAALGKQCGGKGSKNLE